MGEQLVMVLLIVMAVLLVALPVLSARRQRKRDIFSKVPKPARNGKVTAEQAPDLTRNERRRYAKMYKKAQENALHYDRHN